jgi:outer membrane protein OmpA-like peptidoglycan-associated protein
LVAILAGCAAGPHPNSTLDEARIAVQKLAEDPNAAQIASKQLQDARAALALADSAAASHKSDEEVTHLAYLARRQAELGESTLAEARARAKVADGEASRNRVLLQAREHEVGVAREQAREAKAGAAASDAGAATARKSEEDARAQTREAQAGAAASEAGATAARQSEEEARAQTREAQAGAAASEADASAARQSEENARAQLRDLQAKETERGLVLTLGNVLFDTANASLKPGAFLILDRLAGFLKTSPGTRIIVEGHADSRGADEYNQTLSQRRAQSVAEGLASRGVGADRVNMVGRGKRYPVASNDTAEGRQDNRRVEIVFSDTHGKFAPGADR